MCLALEFPVLGIRSCEAEMGSKMKMRKSGTPPVHQFSIDLINPTISAGPENW
jgi:hypothetical protein